MLEYFGAERAIQEITAGDAEDFEQWLIGRGFARATVWKRIGNSKQLWRWAKRRGYVESNVFEGLTSTAVATKHHYFVTREETVKVLDAAPSIGWRTLIALVRFGGLRCPSEVLLLRWGDVKWDKRRMRVRSPKTKRHEGHEERIVPLFPELEPYLREAFEAAPEGTEYVIPDDNIRRPRHAYLRSRMRKIIEDAGLEPWRRTFHNMRASRQTELELQWPGYAVSRVMGNSERIADRHYLMMTDDLMDQMAGGEAVRNPVRNRAEQAGTAGEPQPGNAANTYAFPDVLTDAEQKVAPAGFEPATNPL